MSTKNRLTMSLPDKDVARLEALVKATNASDVTEVIKNALMTYESLVDHVSRGCLFVMYEPNGGVANLEFLFDAVTNRPKLTLVVDNDKS